MTGRKSNGRALIDAVSNRGEYGEKQRAKAKAEIERLALEDKWQKEVCGLNETNQPQDLVYCTVPLPDGTMINGVKVKRWKAIGCFYKGFFYAPLYKDSKGRMLRLHASEIKGWSPLFTKDKFSRAFMARLQLRRQEVIDEHYKGRGI